MADVRIVLDDAKVRKAINDSEGTEGAIQRIAYGIAGRANAMSAGFRTGRYYDRTEGRLKGDTKPRYESDTQKRGKSVVGLVYTGNYAAMKDNHQHNTLLKSI